MLLGESIRQQCIAYRTREGYVNDSIGMDVSDLRVSELEFHPANAMGMNRKVLPRRHFLFELFQVISQCQSSLVFIFDDRTQIRDSWNRGILQAHELPVDGATFKTDFFLELGCGKPAPRWHNVVNGFRAANSDSKSPRGRYDSLE